MTTTGVNTDRVMLLSSDGHATAQMRDYRPYLESRWHEEFDEFVPVFDRVGGNNFDPDNLLMRADPETVARFVARMAPDRLDGAFDPQKRVRELDREGIIAEVLFPDPFCLPFELYGPLSRGALGDDAPEQTPDHVHAAYRAHTRWLVDYCSVAPERFAPLMPLSFDDVEVALSDIKWARDLGVKGIILPVFSAESPVFDPRFDPIWSMLEDFDMVADAHSGSSAVMPWQTLQAPLPHKKLTFTIIVPQVLQVARNLLSQAIWGGVLERHPRLKFVLTECQSGWVIETLNQMDYTYERSYLSHEVHDALKVKPSEYFARQCYLGSSIFSEPEIEVRHEIGVDKMMLGTDYPHHEGAWKDGTLEYLQATLGAVGVPEQEALTMLGDTAGKVFGFDRAKLAGITEQVGLHLRDVLTPPEGELFPRGDVHRVL